MGSQLGAALKKRAASKATHAEALSALLPPERPTSAQEPGRRAPEGVHTGPRGPPALLNPLQLLTTQQAAELLALSVRTLEKWRVEGGGPSFIAMSRKCIRYRMEELRMFQEERLAENTAAARER